MTSASGTRYTELNRLPYYDPIRQHVIDPMHNLLLGTAKHQIQVWLAQNILNDDKLLTIEQRIKNLNIPGDIGRIPSKIGNNFSGFTADQWKHWTCIYSLVALEGVIPQQDYACWSLFVKASLQEVDG